MRCPLRWRNPNPNPDADPDPDPNCILFKGLDIREPLGPGNLCRTWYFGQDYHAALEDPHQRRILEHHYGPGVLAQARPCFFVCLFSAAAAPRHSERDHGPSLTPHPKPASEGDKPGVSYDWQLLYPRYLWRTDLGTWLYCLAGYSFTSDGKVEHRSALPYPHPDCHHVFVNFLGRGRRLPELSLLRRAVPGRGG